MKKSKMRKAMVELIALNAQLHDRVKTLERACEGKNARIEELTKELYLLHCSTKELYLLHCANDKRAKGE